MENYNAKLGSGGGAKTYTNNNNDDDASEHVENPNSNHSDEQQQELVSGSLDSSVQSSPPTPSAAAVARQSARTPFTNLNQVDADLALARTLQEQERAYMMLQMNTEGSDYGSWEAGNFFHHDEDDDFHDDTDVDDDEDDDEEVGEEEYDGADLENDADAFDVHAHNNDVEDNNTNVELDPASFSSDEAYARALQDVEDREMAARLFALAGINDPEDTDDHGGNSQDTWEEVDPDELSYEELLALGEVVGTENRGLSADTIASLPLVNYKTGGSQTGSNDSCVICRLDFEDDETLTVLSCKHSYHSECINNWLKINKVCPVCSTEVSTSGNS